MARRDIRIEELIEVLSQWHAGRSISQIKRSVGIALPDPVIANSAMDRIAHNAHQITMTGESYRNKEAGAKLPTQKNEAR